MTGAGGSADLLHAVARCFFVLAGQQRTGSFRLPYPQDVQLTLDRVVLDCLRHGETPPSSVPDLVQRFTEGSAAAGPLLARGGLVPGEAPLIARETRLPTRTCAELASAGRRGTLEQQAASALDELAARCSSVGAFERCRDFLITRLSLTPREARAKQASPRLASTWAQVQGLYEEVPAAYVTFEMGECLFARCPACGFPAPQAVEERWVCESGYCGVIERPDLHQAAGVQLLTSSLRLFLALPGRPEAEIRRRLTMAGIDLTLIPDGLGAYRFAAPNGRSGVFRVYDREQPVLLAERLAGDADGLTTPKTALIPDRVLARRPDFLDVLAGALPTDAAIDIRTENGLADLIRLS